MVKLLTIMFCLQMHTLKIESVPAKTFQVCIKTHILHFTFLTIMKILYMILKFHSGQSKDSKKSSNTTYYETDMDSNESKDLAAVTALLASYQLAPSSASISQSPPGFQPLTSEIANKYSSQPRTSGNSPGSAYNMVK